jgi:hypothetical protein
MRRPKGRRILLEVPYFPRGTLVQYSQVNFKGEPLAGVMRFFRRDKGTNGTKGRASLRRPGTAQRTLKAHENVLVRRSVTTVRARSRTQSV